MNNTTEQDILRNVDNHEYGITLVNLQSEFGDSIPLNVLEQQCTIVVHPRERDIGVDIRRLRGFLKSCTQPWEHQLEHLKWIFPMIDPVQWETLTHHPEFYIDGDGLYLNTPQQEERRTTCSTVLDLFPTTTDLISFRDLAARVSCPEHVLSRLLRKLVHQRKLRMYSRPGRRKMYRKLPQDL
jgi:hypothetical protein